MKENLVFTVAIVWQSKSRMKLRSSVYSAESSGVKNYDEALGKAIVEQRESFEEPEDYTMLMHNVSCSWQEEEKPDLSCLKYC